MEDLLNLMDSNILRDCMIKIINKCLFLCDHCYVDNAEIKKLDEQTFSELNKLNPIYISLSDYFFKNLSKLSFIEYETIETISRIERKDLI